MRWLMTCLVLLVTCTPAFAAEIREGRDAQTGWSVITAQAGRTQIRVVPAAGFNVYSIEHAGRELLKGPQSLKELPGFMYGNPLLYPSPNRVAGAKFSYGGREYRFEDNNDGNFLHGLVHDVPWTVTGQSVAGGKAVIEAALEFQPGSSHYKLFPHVHTLRVAVTVSEGAVRWRYTVDNRNGDSTIPFGFAFHPWFLYQGTRKNTQLTIPATHWMEAVDLLPTGKLVDLEGSKFDARKPKSLEGFVIDDVYYGMRPEAPTSIGFLDQNVKLSLNASEDFTHLVVYTPKDEDWFCVENQTCSTDAHNLFGRGLKKESHLLEVQPGETHSGFVEYRINDGRKHDFSRWDRAMRAFAKTDRIQAPQPGGVLFVGSSSIRLWDLQKSFPDRDVINRGFGGSEMIDSLYFADQIVLPYRPKTILVYAGDNDVSHGTSAETVAEDFKRFAAKVHQALPQTRIIFIAIKPSIRRWHLYGEMAKANALIAQQAAEDERIIYADIASPMLKIDGKPREELFLKDGLHLNAAGYEVWTSVIEPLLDGGR